MRKTFWNIETNEARKVAGPYATIEAALEARWFYPTVPKLYVVEYEVENHPARAGMFGDNDPALAPIVKVSWGTSFFVSERAAQKYFKPYGCDAVDVSRKIQSGEIHIGKPPLETNQSVIVIDNGTRYMIQEH